MKRILEGSVTCCDVAGLSTKLSTLNAVNCYQCGDSNPDVHEWQEQYCDRKLAKVIAIENERKPSPISQRGPVKSRRSDSK
jgi:hypothetical protein